MKREQQSQNFASVYTLAASQSIAAFAHKHAYTVSKDLGVSVDSISSIAPCTPLQEGIISRSLGSGRPLYFGSFHFQLPSSTDIQKLKRAWERAVARAQILRTCFSLTTDGYAQVVMEKQTMAWDEIYIPNEEKRKATTENRYLKWWRKTQDLRNTPFEAIIIRSPGRTVMCLHMFHALYDGSSLPTLLTRVHMEYLGLNNIDYGPPFQEVLPHGPLCESEGARGFWVQHLSGSQFHRMPSLAPESSPGDSFVTVDLTVAGLETARRSLNTTHQGLIQACWISVLLKYFDGSITIGIVVSGRSIDFEGIENTI
ncbi:putative NRPS-like protein biosynthetic cluster, partial [Trichoglossum hirsutum]